VSESRTIILRNELNAKTLWNELKKWPEQAAANKPIQVVISVWRPIRSNAANKRYWAILTEIQEVMRVVQGRWFSTETLHQFFRDRFAPRIDDPDGKPVPISTSEMTVDQFDEYVSAIEAYAAQELDMEF
jgi:hypothetical protein